MGHPYPSDVSDAERMLLEPFLIDRNAPRGRCETLEFARRSFNAIRHLLKTDCQWRMLPKAVSPHAPR
jgi:transposase